MVSRSAGRLCDRCRAPVNSRTCRVIHALPDEACRNRLPQTASAGPAPSANSTPVTTASADNGKPRADRNTTAVTGSSGSAGVRISYPVRCPSSAATALVSERPAAARTAADQDGGEHLGAVSTPSATQERSDRCKRPAMRSADAERVQSRNRRRTVALVLGKSIAGVQRVQANHLSITGNLRQDGGSHDRFLCSVAARHRSYLGHLQLRGMGAVTAAKYPPPVHDADSPRD